MKKRFILSLLLGIIIGAIGVATVYLFVLGNVDWKAYIETKLIPNAVAAIASMCALYVGAVPALNFVKNAAGQFLNAADKVTKTAENGEQTEKTLSEYDSRIAAFEVRFDGEDEKLETLEESVARLEKIMRIAFGNMDELVKKGYAAEIGKVGKNSERKENKP